MLMSGQKSPHRGIQSFISRFFDERRESDKYHGIVYAALVEYKKFKDWVSQASW